MPFVGAIPQQQLDALPLLTADQASVGGDVTVIGNTLYRIFTPQTIGINGASVQQDPVSLNYFLASAYLDLRGCNYFLLTLRCHNPAGHGLLTGLSLNVQWRMGPGDTPAVFYFNVAVRPFQNAQTTVMGKSGAATLPATVGNEDQTTTYAWSTINPGSSFATEGNSLETCGSNCRLIFTSGTSIIAPANTFTAWLEASS